MADALIAHVARMLAEDDGWRRGFVPMGSTYINGERWQDEPQRPTQAAPAGKPEPVCNPAGVSPRITDKTEERRREAEALAAMNRQLKDLGVSPNA